MGDDGLTELLNRAQRGDEAARERAFELVYQQLKAIAARQLRSRRPGELLSTTALVHEGFLKLAQHHRALLTDRSHFFRLAARAMRQILVDEARRVATDKHGGAFVRTELDPDGPSVPHGAAEMLAIDAALTRLAKLDAELGELVEWRYFGGLSFEEIANERGISDRSVRRQWELARAWLARELGGLP